MSSEFKLSDQTQVSLPVKNIIAIVSAIVVAVWTYFGIVERLNRLETNEKLMAQDLLKKADQTPKNQEMFMLIEYQAKTIDKHSKQSAILALGEYPSSLPFIYISNANTASIIIYLLRYLILFLIYLFFFLIEILIL